MTLKAARRQARTGVCVCVCACVRACVYACVCRERSIVKVYLSKVIVSEFVCAL